MMTDPADLALEEYRNSKDYPDDVNYGIYGRINRAFQDGYVRGRKPDGPMLTQCAVLENENSTLRQAWKGEALENKELVSQLAVANALYQAECKHHHEKIDQLQNVVSQLKGAQEQLRNAGILADIDIPKAYRE